MAIHAHSTTAPTRPLLPLVPFVFRPAPPVDDPRSADELLAEIAAEIDRQADGVEAEVPEPPLENGPAASAARTLHLRRQLEAAAEHGVELLAALGLPRLVGPDFVQVDRGTIGDALDVVIFHLDALDEDPEAEDGTDAEHDTADSELPLGWAALHSQVSLGNNTDDGDLTALERHGRGFLRSGPDDAEDSDPAERDDEHGSEDGEDIGHHASQHAPQPLSPASRAEVAVMAARAAQVRRVLHV